MSGRMYVVWESISGLNLSPAQRRISLANCIRKESGGLGRNKSGDIGRVIVKSLRADAYMYNRTLRNEEDVKIDVRART